MVMRRTIVVVLALVFLGGLVPGVTEANKVFPKKDVFEEKKWDGVYKEFDRNGILLKASCFKNGQLLWIKVYYVTGQLREEGQFKYGGQDGITRVYDKNGNLRAEWHYRNDKLEGTSKGYFPNGNVMAEWHHKNDRLEGISKGYHENGEIRYVDYYRNDQKVSRRTFDRNGSLELELNYPYVGFDAQLQ